MALDLDACMVDYGEYMGNFTGDINVILNQCCQERPSINHTIMSTKANFELICLLLSWVLVKNKICIKKVSAATTQFAHTSVCLPLHQKFKSTFLLAIFTDRIN
jgi:hypothetical protein